jgi:hypothetical protein
VRWRHAGETAEGNAERTGGAITDALRDFLGPALASAQQAFGQRLPPGQQNSIGGNPTSLRNRPKKTERNNPAEAVWRAATDPSGPMCLPAGTDAIAAAA